MTDSMDTKSDGKQREVKFLSVHPRWLLPETTPIESLFKTDLSGKGYRCLNCTKEIKQLYAIPCEHDERKNKWKWIEHRYFHHPKCAKRYMFDHKSEFPASSFYVLLTKALEVFWGMKKEDALKMKMAPPPQSLSFFNPAGMTEAEFDKCLDTDTLVWTAQGVHAFERTKLYAATEPVADTMTDLKEGQPNNGQQPPAGQRGAKKVYKASLGSTESMCLSDYFSENRISLSNANTEAV